MSKKLLMDILPLEALTPLIINCVKLLLRGIFAGRIFAKWKVKYFTDQYIPELSIRISLINLNNE